MQPSSTSGLRVSAINGSKASVTTGRLRSAEPMISHDRSTSVFVDSPACEMMEGYAMLILELSEYGQSWNGSLHKSPSGVNEAWLEIRS